VIVHNQDDRKQTYISGNLIKIIIFLIGIEGSEGITALAMSTSKKFLAICEKADHAVCSVYVS
jgi:hypothetical protein